MKFLPILGTVFLFMVIGAFFVAAETALITLRDSQIKRLAETKGRRGRRLEMLVKKPLQSLTGAGLSTTAPTL